MSLSERSARRRRGLVADLLTFDRLLTGPVVHMIYWCGLCLILLLGFGAVGGAIGLALRSISVSSALLALPAVVAALLLVAVLSLVWRGLCEFYLSVFSIAEDLHALRIVVQKESVAREGAAGARRPGPASGPPLDRRSEI